MISESKSGRPARYTILPKSRKPVITEGSVAVRISPSNQSGEQDVMPAKVDRVSVMKREENSQTPAQSQRLTHISPGYGTNKNNSLIALWQSS